VRKALAIARRDLGVVFGGPLAWTLIGAFTFLAGYFFYTDLTFYVLFGGGNLPAGLWRYVFLHYRLVALLVVPLVTMRLVAEERKLGTLELLWSLPVRDRDVLAGKLVAALVVYFTMLVGSAIGPLVLYVLHPYALPPLAAGYVGMLLLGFAFVACGLAASCVSENQVVSAMLTYGVLVFLWFVSANEAALGEGLGWIVLGLSLFDRFYGFAQGVIDSRDVVFFLAFAALWLFLALRALGARTWRGLA
jgi:gliding motility-associated transport system permease protein